MFACLEEQTAVPSALRELGAKPPENQPQLTPLDVSMSPTLRPDIATFGVLGELQSSNFAASPPVEMIEPLATAGVGSDTVAP